MKPTEFSADFHTHFLYLAGHSAQPDKTMEWEEHLAALATITADLNLDS